MIAGYKIRFVVPCLLALWLSAGASVRPAYASTVYIYTGNPFDEFPDPAFGCPPVCNVTGSFTVAAPLSSDMSLTLITPLAFSITSGGVTLTDGIPADTELNVGTDSAGAISTWSWLVTGPASGRTARILTENLPGIVADDVRLSAAGSLPLPLVGKRVGQVSSDPGTWSESPVPEPKNLLLLGMGLLGIVGVARRRRST